MNESSPFSFLLIQALRVFFSLPPPILNPAFSSGLVSSASSSPLPVSPPSLIDRENLEIKTPPPPSHSPPRRRRPLLDCRPRRPPGLAPRRPRRPRRRRRWPSGLGQRQRHRPLRRPQGPRARLRHHLRGARPGPAAGDARRPHAGALVDPGRHRAHQGVGVAHRRQAARLRREEVLDAGPRGAPRPGRHAALRHQRRRRVARQGRQEGAAGQEGRVPQGCRHARLCDPQEGPRQGRRGPGCDALDARRRHRRARLERGRERGWSLVREGKPSFGSSWRKRDKGRVLSKVIRRKKKRKEKSFVSCVFLFLRFAFFPNSAQRNNCFLAHTGGGLAIPKKKCK